MNNKMESEIQNTKLNSVVDSINLLIRAVEKGQKAGAYTLADAAKIVEAITYIQKDANDEQD